MDRRRAENLRRPIAGTDQRSARHGEIDDPFRFGQAATSRHVRLHDRDSATIHHVEELPASDAVLAQTNFANEQFLRSATTWLARRTAATDIPEAEVAAFQVNASDGGLFAVLGLLLAAVPCVCLGVAMLTWWDRR